MFIHLLSHAGEVHSSWHMPPLHPIFVNFTAALIPASVLSDWLGRYLHRDSFHKAAWWMLLYAAVVTPITAAAGWWWMREMKDMNDWRLPVHMWLGFSLTAVAIALAVWRGCLHRTGRAPGLAYLLVASVAVAAIVVQGELGGQMSFGAMESSSETSHESEPAAHGSTHHDSMSIPASQPATKPDGHEHQHGSSSGALHWRDHIDLNG
jgi:uncharacterized membrane protein